MAPRGKRRGLKKGQTHSGSFKKGNKLGEFNRGRPRRRDFLSQALISQLHEIDKSDRRNVPKFHRIVENMIDAALKKRTGLHAADMIFDRVEGKPRQAVEVGGFDGYSKIQIEVVAIPSDGTGSQRKITQDDGE